MMSCWAYAVDCVFLLASAEMNNELPLKFEAPATSFCLFGSVHSKSVISLHNAESEDDFLFINGHFYDFRLFQVFLFIRIWFSIL